MVGKSSSGSRAGGNQASPNDTGKSGNDSGSRVKEARGPSYQERHRKHPPNQLFTGPKEMDRNKQR
jgi:hypothetical protein